MVGQGVTPAFFQEKTGQSHGFRAWVGRLEREEMLKMYKCFKKSFQCPGSMGLQDTLNDKTLWPFLSCYIFGNNISQTLCLLVVLIFTILIVIRNCPLRELIPPKM
mmetsp:Transcript_9428/g.13934  ORF Transcript_9428/g.13934 Transcript_9428/m.13934 type:complete len:106 (+) Transcript_9428:2428-2745(+)